MADIFSSAKNGLCFFVSIPDQGQRT